MTVTLYRIVRLQIQTGPMKPGKAPLREYRTDGLQQVDRLMVTERGNHGEWLDGDQRQRTIDVHHQDHPQSRNRKGGAGVTVLGTGDYTRLRARYGDHLIDGSAGESVLVEAPDGIGDLDFPAEFAISTADGMINFDRGRVADPCVEFSRFCLGEVPSPQVSDAVRQALIDLGDGHRGYRAAALNSGIVHVGDTLLLPG